ncbi:hypothetical protein LEP1GSC058_2509 [Leptospira fainei serovar Hurstbridge str. BUT 6]|uniref:Uncharacterized protein n=1 Tax=Leptospira fainei serovar Hurstbridge str. BUT 6 TaxID=1193011 RepID=S3W1Z4_9LEPT|nr:hypothetical protein LEP1GSC058_2509 [Leptospira fainei serovar Hurstbridge str. BUT 6]
MLLSETDAISLGSSPTRAGALVSENRICLDPTAMYGIYQTSKGYFTILDVRKERKQKLKSSRKNSN